MARQISVLVVAAVGIALGVLAFQGRDSGELASGASTTRESQPVYDPTEAGEELPQGYRQLLPRDAIKPVYQPRFVPADEIGWDDDDLVIGLSVDNESKAYPVGFLNRREMVIDSIAGIPVLVTW